jgi:hypothetical protein
MQVKRVNLKTWWALAPAIWLAACASSVNVDYDRKFSFSSIKTYKVADKAANQSGDTQLDNPFVAKRIINAIKVELNRRGYTYDKDNADARIVFHVQKKTGLERRSTATFGYGVGPYGYYGGMGMVYGYPGYYIESYEEGVLTIDIVDNKNNTLVWRGSTGRRLYNGSTPEKSTQAINEIVAEILERFPPDIQKNTRS